MPACQLTWGWLMTHEYNWGATAAANAKAAPHVRHHRVKHHPKGASTEEGGTSLPWPNSRGVSSTKPSGTYGHWWLAGGSTKVSLTFILWMFFLLCIQGLRTLHHMQAFMHAHAHAQHDLLAQWSNCSQQIVVSSHQWKVAAEVPLSWRPTFSIGASLEPH